MAQRAGHHVEKYRAGETRQRDAAQHHQHLLNGVGLVGVPAARDAATAFDGVLRTLGEHAPERTSDFAAGLREGYGAIEGELTDRFRVMMDAMSADVAPEGSR